MSAGRFRSALLGLAAASVVTAPAVAVDGVIEINQARAMAGGITAGDGPGFPVTISQPGSYRLTSNLDISDEATPANVTGVLVTASFVTLDLNGFEIAGPTVCTGLPVTGCSPTGTGDGIDSTAANFVRIHDGTVRGFGELGIVTGQATIENVRVYYNGGTGIWLQAGGIVTGCEATRNGFDGIAGGGTLVSASLATYNKLSGFYIAPGAVIDSTAAVNNIYGIGVPNGLAAGNLVTQYVVPPYSGCAIYAPGGAYGNNVLWGTVPHACAGVKIENNLCQGGACP